MGDHPYICLVTQRFNFTSNLLCQFPGFAAIVSWPTSSCGGNTRTAWVWHNNSGPEVLRIGPEPDRLGTGKPENYRPYKYPPVQGVSSSRESVSTSSISTGRNPPVKWPAKACHAAPGRQGLSPLSSKRAALTNDLASTLPRTTGMMMDAYGTEDGVARAIEEIRPMQHRPVESGQSPDISQPWRARPPDGLRNYSRPTFPVPGNRK